MKTRRFSFALSLALAFTLLLPAGLRAGAIKYRFTPGDMSWPGGRVPYVFKPEVTGDRQLVFKRSVRAWQRFANLRFIPTTEYGFHQSTEGNYLLVQHNDLRFFDAVKDVNYAFIGRCGSFTYPFTGMQPISIHNWKGRTVVHELGHVLGFIHEQMRNDRDNFVALNWWNINPLTAVNWNKEPNAVYRSDSYDYDSVMHYDNLAFQTAFKSETDYTMTVPGNPALTESIGATIPNYDDRHEGAIGLITMHLSDGDRKTIRDEYGAPTELVVTVKLPNNKPLPKVNATLLGNGGPDEIAFSSLLSATSEKNVKSDDEGKFRYRGVPTGNYKVQLSKTGFTFSQPEILFTGGSAPLIEVNVTATNAETTPPTLTISTPPPPEETTTYHKVFTGIAGKAADTGGAGLKEIQVRLKKGSQWMNWTTQMFDAPDVFDDAVHVGKMQATSLPDDNWTSNGAPWNSLTDGTYVLSVQSMDFSNNLSEMETRTFVFDTTNPTMTLDPVAGGGSTFFDFTTTPLGGDVTDALDPEPDVTFTICEYHFYFTDRKYWNGSAWVSDFYDPKVKLPGVVEGGRWRPADTVTLPARSQLANEDFQISATITDRAGNSNSFIFASLRHRTPLDTTIPAVAFSPSRHEAVYTERTMPVITGTSSDDESYIQGIELYLMRLVPNGGGFLYWNGEAWQSGVTYLAVDVTPVPGNPKHVTWSAPGLDYSLPSGADLPDAAYQIQIATHNREAPQLGTQLITESFQVAVDPPRVAVTSVTHNGWAKAGWTLGGTVTDTAGVGFSDSNRVSLTINRDGEYWDGNSWESSPEILYADILPDSTWTYPGTTPDAQMPTGDGSYSVSVHVRDRNSNVNAIIAGGLPGNNQLIFNVDATPPLLALASPAPGAVVDASPLPSNWINGTASDSSGAVTVTFRLKRLPSVVFTDVFWNEETWRDPVFGFGADIDLDGTFPGDNGPTSWKFTGHQPKPGWDFNHCMINGAYEVVAIAKDLAGNETELTRSFTVDYHPQYIPPEFENMPMQPLQVPPFPTSALGGNNASSFNPLMPEDTRSAYARKLVKSPTGPYYVASQLSPSLSNEGGADLVLQRLGGSAWRIEHQSYATIDALDTDAAGNLYALYRYKTSAKAVLVKYSPAGGVVWTRDVPEVVGAAFIGGPTLKRMGWLPDGALGLLFTFTESFGGYYSHEMVMAVIETDGDVRYIQPFGIVNPGNHTDPANFESAPVDFAGDAAGNVFVASIETERFTDYGEFQAPDARRIIRKLSPAGTTLATHITITCDFPEYWDRLATDPAGNLYVAGRFMSGIRSQNDPGRQEMLKFDNNLALQWRAFGPARNPEAGDTVSHIDADADGVMTIDNSGMAAFFTSGGALKWARPIIEGGGNSYLFTFAGGSAVGILHTGSIYITQHLVKISRAGDTQFDLPFTTNQDQIFDLRADTSDIHLLRQSLGSTQPYIDSYYNIPDATIPVTLDPVQPRDQVLITGDELRLQVINSGSLATGHQWRKYDNGTPVNIPGATSDTFTIGSVVLGDAGQFDCLVTNPNNNATSRTATIAVLPPAAFDVALDTPGRTWTTGGDAPFVGFMAQNPAGPAHDNVDATMNRPIGPNQTSFIETTVTGPGTVTFWWKSSNEQFMDTFTFSIDGNDLDYLTGEQGWTQVSEDFGPGTHTLRWTYYKVGNSTSTQDRVWLDDVVIVGSSSIPLADALDTTGLTWTTSAGGLAWTGITTLSHDGVDSATTGTTGNSQQSYVETTVTGPGSLTFWWKVSSEPTFDTLALTINGGPSGSISGTVDWVQQTRTIPAGSQTLRWSYNKDGFGIGGIDKAWLDEVVFTPGSSPAPEIVVEQPELNGLTDNASTVDFGTALPGNNTVRTFTIRNTGNAQLSGLVVTRNGTNDTDFALGSLGQNSLNPGDFTTFTVTFTPGASDARTAALHIQSNDADENTFDINLMGSGGVPVTSWRQQHFLTTANTGDAADDADPDHDGKSNLLEFATGAGPNTASSATENIEPPEGGLVEFLYTRNKLAMAELTFQVEWADNLLGPWSSAGVVETILSDNGLIQQVRATFPAGTSGRRFAWLKVTRP